MVEGVSAPQSDLGTMDPSDLLFYVLPDPWSKRSAGGSFMSQT